jgi:hypothetical protein
MSCSSSDISRSVFFPQILKVRFAVSIMSGVWLSCAVLCVDQDRRSISRFTAARERDRSQANDRF